MKEFLQNLEGKTILDVGTFDGGFISFLTAHNAVKGIDIKNGEDVRDFPIKENEYDIIVARNVLPFLKKEEIFEVIDTLYKGSAEYFLFTLFGENDPWAKVHKHMTFVNDEDVALIKAKYPLEQFNYRYNEGNTMSGEKKLWEVYTFILKK